eukprot:UN20034
MEFDDLEKDVDEKSYIDSQHWFNQLDQKFFVNILAIYKNQSIIHIMINYTVFNIQHWPNLGVQVPSNYKRKDWWCPTT